MDSNNMVKRKRLAFDESRYDLYVRLRSQPQLLDSLCSAHVQLNYCVQSSDNSMVVIANRSIPSLYPSLAIPNLLVLVF
jgi:hypothetical protein